MTPRETARLLAVIAGLWPNFKGDERTRDAWAIAFRNVSYQDAESALMLLFETGERTFAPTASELFAAVKRITRPPESDLRAEEAWSLVVQAVRRFGFYQELGGMASLPPAVAAAAKAVTWGELCHSENQEALRAHFFRCYDSMARRAEAQRHLPQASNGRLENASPLVQQVLSEIINPDTKEPNHVRIDQQPGLSAAATVPRLVGGTSPQGGPGLRPAVDRPDDGAGLRADHRGDLGREEVDQIAAVGKARVRGQD